MFLSNIKAKFSVVHFSGDSLLTFFPFSDCRSARGIKDEIDTSVPLIFIFFAIMMILLAISDGSWLLFKSFVPVCKITMSGFLAMVGLIQSFISSVVAPGKDFTILKYPLRDWFKLRLGIFRTTESPTKAHVVEEAKMLIKLIVVDPNYFIRCKCKSTHCLDSQTLLGSQTLSEFI